MGADATSIESLIDENGNVPVIIAGAGSFLPTLADDAAFTPATSKVSPVGFLVDETTPDSVDEGDIGAARMTLDRKQWVVAETESNAMRISGVTVTPKFKTVTVAASQTDSELIAAVASKKLRILAWAALPQGAAVTSLFESGGSTSLTGTLTVPASGFGGGYNPVGWFETASGASLTVTTGAGASTNYILVYIEV